RREQAADDGHEGEPSQRCSIPTRGVTLSEAKGACVQVRLLRFAQDDSGVGLRMTRARAHADWLGLRMTRARAHDDSGSGSGCLGLRLAMTRARARDDSG